MALFSKLELLVFMTQICDDPSLNSLGINYEPWQNAICANYGVCAMENFWTNY